MSLSRIDRLRLQLEDWRLRQHFKRVEHVLRTQDLSHLSPTLRQARQRHLDQLHIYATRGIFPRNHERPGYSPCFIDRDGRECAVAHLMIVSGHAATARHIAAVANYAYVPQMTFLELDEWAAQSGMSREELALIQPGYYLTFTGDLMWMAIATWTAGLVISAINGIQFARHRTGLAAPMIAFACATVLLLFSLVYLYGYTTANYIGTHPDVPSGMRENALREAGYFIQATVVSLGIALLVGRLGYYRARAFYRARDKNRQQPVGDLESTTVEVTGS